MIVGIALCPMLPKHILRGLICMVAIVIAQVAVIRYVEKAAQLGMTIALCMLMAIQTFTQQ